MAGRSSKIDRAEQALIDLYQEADAVLRAQIAEALSSGALGTAKYRQQRLVVIQKALSDFQDAAIPAATRLITEAYVGGASASAVQTGSAVARFGSGVHLEAMNILADNLANGLNGAAEMVGRRTADLFRRAGLEEASGMIARGAGLRETRAALTAALQDQGVTSFIDAAGRSWELSRYASMVIRTNTADAIVRGNINAALEDGYDLVEVLVLDDELLCEICSPYDDTTYSLTGSTPGVEVLTDAPPFHPNCRCDLNTLVTDPRG